MLQFAPVRPGSIFLDFAENLYITSFSPNERRDFNVAVDLQTSSPVTFFVIFENDIAIGILVIWELADFLYIEHLAIDPNLRGKGLGSGIVKEILSKSLKQVILEVERPETIEAQRRIRFYQNMGLVLNADWNYIQPAYDKEKEAVPMFLMSRNPLDSTEYEKIRDELYARVYSINQIF